MDSNTEKKKRQEAEAEDGMSMDYKNRDKKGKIVCDHITLHGLYVPVVLFIEVLFRKVCSFMPNKHL